MKPLLIKGAMLVTPTEERFADLLIEDGLISELCQPHKSSAGTEIMDLGGAYLSPGLFDMQVNGGPGCDFWAELDHESLSSFSCNMIMHGVTSILPTLITGDMQGLKRNREFLKPYLGTGSKEGLFRMPGIHFEGPCLSVHKPGVHPPEHLQELKRSVIDELVDDSCLLMTLAPELDPEGSVIRYLIEKQVLCSIGHSNASFEEAKDAFKHGVNMMTHTFNALPPLHHRAPGAVAAALLDRNVSCCLIPDGLHVLPEMLDLVIRTKGVDKVVLVSDMAAIGTSQGSLVGSSLYLSEGVSNLVKWGLTDFASAIRMASYNPARLLGLENQIGSIKAGAFADLIVWDRDTLEIKNLIFNGKPLKQAMSV